MKITKFEHATLLIEKAGSNLVIDPGVFLSSPDFSDVVAIVITHEHQDHWSPDAVQRILDRNGAVRVFGPAGVADAVAASEAAFPVEVVAAGDSVEAAPFTLKFFGEKHAVIHESIPIIDNVGVLVDDELYYPGDSYTVPEVEVATLAAPIGAPWLKIGDAIDFVLAVKPQRAFYSHDMTLSAAGKGMGVERLTWATEQGGGEFFPLEVGESLDV